MKQWNRLLEDGIDPHHRKSTGNLLRSLLPVLSGGLWPISTVMWSLCGLSEVPEMPISSCPHPRLCPSCLSVVTAAGWLGTLLKGLKSSGKHRACWVPHLALTLFKNLVIIESYCASSCIINIIIYYLWSAECVLDAYMIIHWVALELHSLVNYDVMLLPAAFAWEWYFSFTVVGSFIMWWSEQDLWILSH